MSINARPGLAWRLRVYSLEYSTSEQRTRETRDVLSGGDYRFARLLGDGGVNLLEDGVDRPGDVPGRVVGAHLAEIADVADVVALPVLLDVLVAHFTAGQLGDTVECLEDRDAIGPATADIVDLAAARPLPELVDEPRDIERVDVIANLLALVAKYLVGAALDVALDEVAQKTMQFHAAVVR